MTPRTTLLIPIAALLATACGGPKPLTLPQDPVERAATCGVVAAASARTGSTDVKTPLTMEQQASILHYALLGGGEGKDFSQDRVGAVVQRMPELEAGITGAKWQELVQPCREAFPATAPGKPVELPRDPQEARVSCYMLSEFLTKSLGQHEAALGDQLAEYGAMNRALDPKIGVSLKARGLSKDQARDARREALGGAAQLGPPVAVMKACLDKFG
jgi:hypothetical protein